MRRDSSKEKDKGIYIFQNDYRRVAVEANDFAPTKISILKLMEKCEDFYEKDSEYDAGEPKDTKRKLVGKRHVDTSKTTGEHRAQKY